MKFKHALVTLLLLCSLLGCFFLPASASETDTPDWGSYSYEELLAIRESLDSHIRELEIQYAIENGNRVIDLNEDDITVYQGKQFSFAATVTPVIPEAPEKTDLVWLSSDETVVKVSAAGVVSAVGYGDAEITCSAEDDPCIFAKATVHVVLPVTGLTLDLQETTLTLSYRDPAGAAGKLVCQVAPENAYIPDICWSSSDETVVTVDEAGAIQAVAPGTAVVSAASQDPFATAKPATCKVTVLQKATSLTLSDSQLTLSVSAKKDLVGTVSPENASDKKVSWQSSNPAVATVSQAGKVTAVAPGTAIITCAATDGSGCTAACRVTVIQMVSSLKIGTGAKTITVNRGSSTTLSVSISPENASNQTLRWVSSDPAVATVDSSGKATATGGGSATVTCESTDGSKKTASVEIYVPSIGADQDTYTVTSKDGIIIALDYYGKPEDLTITPLKCAPFSYTWKQMGDLVTITIQPEKAGTAKLTIADKGDSRSKVTLSIEVAHSACYDSVSYPVGNYTNILRSPSSYDGQDMSAYGRVIQLSKGLFGSVMRVATKGRVDNVFYVTCSNSLVEGIIEGDYITIYGTCEGTETYKTILGASVTIPAIDAEKIFLGKH